MDEQTVFDATAQKLYKDYVDADNVIAHAQCAADAADFIAACEIVANATDLPPLLVPVVTPEVVTDCLINQIDQAGIRKLFVAARCLNEVLKPQMFKSDWRVKWERKGSASAKLAQDSKYGGHIKSKNSFRNEVKRVIKEEDSNKYAGSKYKRQRGAAMTDYAM